MGRIAFSVVLLLALSVPKYSKGHVKPNVGATIGLYV